MLSDVVELGQNVIGGDVFASAAGFVAGGEAAAIVHWTLMMPMECVKTIQQASVSSSETAAAVAARVFRTSGVAGFFVGFSAVLARGCSMDVIQFSAADWLRVKLDHQPLQRRTSVHLLPTDPGPGAGD